MNGLVVLTQSQNSKRCIQKRNISRENLLDLTKTDLYKDRESVPNLPKDFKRNRLNLKCTYILCMNRKSSVYLNNNTVFTH